VFRSKGRLLAIPPENLPRTNGLAYFADESTMNGKGLKRLATGLPRRVPPKQLSLHCPPRERRERQKEIGTEEERGRTGVNVIKLFTSVIY